MWTQISSWISLKQTCPLHFTFLRLKSNQALHVNGIIMFRYRNQIIASSFNIPTGKLRGPIILTATTAVFQQLLLSWPFCDLTLTQLAYLTSKDNWEFAATSNALNLNEEWLYSWTYSSFLKTRGRSYTIMWCTNKQRTFCYVPVRIQIAH